MAGFIKKYFNWLQKDNPAGEVEIYPEIDENGETSIPGIFIAGDLTGIPLLKFALQSGKKTMEYISGSESFQKSRDKNTGDIYDIIIVGAGPAGISAALEAKKQGLSFKVLEAARTFSTLENFPKEKPMYLEPGDLTPDSSLEVTQDVKESLIEELCVQVKEQDIEVATGVEVTKIDKKNGFFELITNGNNEKALRVILTIGKSGNSRKLDVPGENLDKVYNRLFDPADTKGEKVLVVGGGDSALETAIALSEYADSTTLSYRKDSFSRPKAGNIEKLQELANEGKVELLLETEVKEVREESVILTDASDNEKEIENSVVYAMIGKELPLDFFKRSNIKMEGEMTLTSKLQFLLLILISAVIYFGKVSADFSAHFTGLAEMSFSEVLSRLITTEFWISLFSLPTVIIQNFFSEQTTIWNWTNYASAMIAYASFIGSLLLGTYLFINFLRRNAGKFKADWQTFKYGYFIFVGAFFLFVFFSGKYYDYHVLGKSQSFWYTGFYSLTILIFGIRRIHAKPTGYIKRQTWTLILIQVIPLFILPELLLPYLGSIGALGGPESFVHTQMFPNESYWRSYGFILAWPLFFFNLFNSDITTFWLVVSLLQTFVIIPYIVYRWGKGAYCGWICSCGAMAETLGDEYRTKAPHGEKAKRWENIGQVILFFAFVITGLKLFSILFHLELPVINESLSYSVDFAHSFYYVAVDIIFAGVLGIGVYFFLSGRIWCRYGCPLAALMHIYARFTRYRIFADKKKCISCNICTKVCHMGIDVMHFANKGIPMNDVQCVRCSACVMNCPTGVLFFGSLPEADPDNELYKKIDVVELVQKGWKKGL